MTISVLVYYSSCISNLFALFLSTLQNKKFGVFLDGLFYDCVVMSNKRLRFEIEIYKTSVISYIFVNEMYY